MPSIHRNSGWSLGEFVAEDVLQYLTPSALVDRVEDVLVSHDVQAQCWSPSTGKPVSSQ